MRLRRAEPADYEAVGAVTLAAYEPFLLGAEDDYRHRLLDVATRDRDAEVWVATPDDSHGVLGNITICPEGSTYRELAAPGEGEFRMLAVAPTAQRQGVGLALVELALDRFRADGVRTVVLSSLDMMAGAHRIYDRLGFSRAPDQDWSPMPDVSLLAFRLELR